MKKYWILYKKAIINNCTESDYGADAGISYWKDILFANILIFLLPFCLISLLPVIILNFFKPVMTIIVVDLLTLSTVIFIILTDKIKIITKKILFISCVYLFSFMLLFLAETPAPGVLYLYACSIFSIMMFDDRYKYYWSHFNALICVLLGLLLFFGIKVTEEDAVFATIHWIAISANLVFLSYLSSALIPLLFGSIESYIKNQNQLQSNLVNSHNNLEKTLLDLDKKNRELEHFAYTASHDLQEPLRMVSGFLTQLNRKYENQLDDKARQYIHFAVDGAKRMRQIILDLLDYSRVGINNEKLERIDINLLVQEVMDLLQPIIEEKGARINFHKLPVIQSYHGALLQVFQNLIGNSLKYASEGRAPEVTIHHRELNEHWQFSVQDNGIGIEEIYFDKVFVLFQRLHDNTQYSGTGIGLSTVRKIVESLEGRVWLESKLEKGSVFHFTIKK